MIFFLYVVDSYTSSEWIFSSWGQNMKYLFSCRYDYVLLLLKWWSLPRQIKLKDHNFILFTDSSCKHCTPSVDARSLVDLKCSHHPTSALRHIGCQHLDGNDKCHLQLRTWPNGHKVGTLAIINYSLPYYFFLFVSKYIKKKKKRN